MILRDYLGIPESQLAGVSHMRQNSKPRVPRGPCAIPSSGTNAGGCSLLAEPWGRRRTSKFREQEGHLGPWPVCAFRKEPPQRLAFSKGEPASLGGGRPGGCSSHFLGILPRQPQSSRAPQNKNRCTATVHTAGAQGASGSAHRLLGWPQPVYGSAFFTGWWVP